MIYKSHLRSYRDLPIRYGELGTVYRYERTGVLHGLLRVRGFTQDDAHLFCRPDQIETEVSRVLDFTFFILRHVRIHRIRSVSLDQAERVRRARKNTGPTRRARSKRRSRAENIAYQIDPGGGRLLRTENRHQDQGCLGPFLAMLDHSGRFQQSRTVRIRLHWRRRQELTSRS